MKKPARRNTPQRRLIAEIVRQSPDHPTAEEIYRRAVSRAPNLSLGTVYRNLALLCEMREIQRIPVPNGPDHYDFRIPEHCHFLCTGCGRMFDVPDRCAPPPVQLRLTDAPDFEVSGQFLIYTGLCRSCREA